MGTAPPKGSSTAGFFSSSKRLALTVGPAVDVNAVGGYPIDMRVKAKVAEWPPDWAPSLDGHYVSLIQYGLGCYERFLAGDGEVWLETALAAGRHLVAKQETDGSWLNSFSVPHTFSLKAPWRCGMAQGEAASLLVRLSLTTGEEVFAQTARAALAPLSRSSANGGVSASLEGAPWPEEFPTQPSSFVLNGAMFAWWGLRDVAVGLGDAAARDAFEAGVDALAANLWRFDTGTWSLYCLYPHPVRPVASSFYHALHIEQLKAMDILAPRPEFSVMETRWERYLQSRRLRWLAFSRKALFRLMVPRNRLLANRLPWSEVPTDASA
jgi:heparosan-N-sulfate-glucuronate 5-epimerase